MLDEESWRRIARYALGECTAAEAVETRAWIEADPDRQRVAEELIRLADAGPTAMWDAKTAWKRFAAGSSHPSRPVLSAREHPIGRGRARGWIAAAAALTLAVGSGALWLSSRAPEPVAVAPAPLREAVTKRGETADIYLSDGSRVALGAGSTLRFPSTFGQTRDVYLEGEAYFDVAHDEQRPFSVHTATAVARDLGTRFNVSAYGGGLPTEVVVAEGAVALKAAADSASSGPRPDSLILTQADLGRVEPHGALTVRRRVDVESYLAWMQGRLEFADTPIQEALPRLSRWYDVNIELGDSSIADARLTASLEIESLAEALKLMTAALDARVEWRGRTVILHSRRHTQRS